MLETNNYHVKNLLNRLVRDEEICNRLINARDLLINGNDTDAIEWTIGAIESTILELGGSLPIYRVRGVMYHDTKEAQFTYTNEIFNSVDQAQEYIDDDSDLFAEGCAIDCEVDPELEGYLFDDLEIVRVATKEFPIEVLEIM
jgi:hypothetical protein